MSFLKVLMEAGVKARREKLATLMKSLREDPPELHPNDCRCLRCISLRVD